MTGEAAATTYGAELGRCVECGQELVLTADDCWHPFTVKRACPPEVWTGGVWRGVVWGEGPGRPGRDKWRKA